MLVYLKHRKFPYMILVFVIFFLFAKPNGNSTEANSIFFLLS